MLLSLFCCTSLCKPIAKERESDACLPHQGSGGRGCSSVTVKKTPLNCIPFSFSSEDGLLQSHDFIWTYNYKHVLFTTSYVIYNYS